MKIKKAYAHGVLDGFNVGENENPYNPQQDAELHQAYEEGYDYGVFLYAQELETLD
jgi:hypothetical protein